MFKLTSRLPSPALVISMIALALVLGGTAVAASVSGDTRADTTLIKKLAPTLSVKKSKSADALGRVTYVTGNIVDAPANGGIGFHETAASTATCPPNTIVIGTATTSGGPGVEVSTAHIFSKGKGTPPNRAVAIFDNFTNTDFPQNYVTAICSAAASWMQVHPANRRAAGR